jgi:pimeloyl-ACP methyl ester carboxylesterase
MQRAGRNEEGVPSALAGFREPFAGFHGAWHFMEVLRWGKPCDVLAHFSNILPQLPAPTLILQGLRDPAIPLSFSRRAQNLIPNSQLVYVDCGHFIPLNRPAFVATQLTQFFGQSAVSVSAFREEDSTQSWA